ncbi:unnamed protein product, partial [Citrullus colocynthis]
MKGKEVGLALKTMLQRKQMQIIGLAAHIGSCGKVVKKRDMGIKGQREILIIESGSKENEGVRKIGSGHCPKSN